MFSTETAPKVWSSERKHRRLSHGDHSRQSKWALNGPDQIHEGRQGRVFALRIEQIKLKGTMKPTRLRESEKKMQTQKTEFLFVIRRGVAEAVDENPQLTLSLDYKVPDPIVAFVSPKIHNEISRQLVKNPGLDGVCLRASLSSLIEDACEFLEDGQAIDRWVTVLEGAIERLRDHKRERETALRAVCEACSHSAIEHYRPHLGDISCHRRGCSCPEFAPLTKLLLKDGSGPQLSSVARGTSRSSITSREI
jgi:hypothetical protein